MEQKPTYLDDQGNPAGSTAPIYLDDNGNPVKPAATQEAKPAGAAPDSRSWQSVLADQADAVRKGVTGAVTGIPGFIGDVLMGRGAQQVPGMIQGLGAPITTSARGLGALADAYDVPQVSPFGLPSMDAVRAPGPTRAEWEQGASGAGGMLGSALAGAIPEAIGARVVPLIDRLKAAMPSIERAGAKFEEVNKVAKDIPIDTAPAQSILDRAIELRQRGSTLPKVMNDFSKNRAPQTANFGGVPVTMPPDPMTYEVGRDFASNAGALSTRETTAMNAKMQRQVGQFAEAMKDANREAAASVGMGDLHDSAMKEYRQAKTLGEAADVLKTYGRKAALAALLGGAGAAGYEAYSKLK